MYKPTISFRVDFVEVKAKEGEKQEAKEVKNFPLTYFAVRILNYLRFT
jgi:hypothetical protein